MATVTKELGTVGAFLKRYGNMNDTVKASTFLPGPRSSPFYRRLNCEPSTRRENGCFQPDNMNFPPQILVLDN